MDEKGPKEPQAETVHAPHRDDDPPTRTKQPVLWITLAMVAMLVMVVLLIFAAVRAA